MLGNGDPLIHCSEQQHLKINGKIQLIYRSKAFKSPWLLSGHHPYVYFYSFYCWDNLMYLKTEIILFCSQLFLSGQSFWNEVKSLNKAFPNLTLFNSWEGTGLIEWSASKGDLGEYVSNSHLLTCRESPTAFLLRGAIIVAPLSQ